MSPIVFPRLRAPDVVLTPKMLQAQDRILHAHKPRGQMVVLTGDAGAGKTTAALHIANSINQGHEDGVEDSFAAAYFVSSDLRQRMKVGLLQRRLLSEFAKMVLRLSMPRDLRSLDVPGLLTSIAAGLRLANTQVVFIDEAGHIPPEGLDHLVTLINTVATRERHPLTVVLVGMDDLPINVDVMPQVQRRVVDRVFFEPYDTKTALFVLRMAHPFFETVDPETVAGSEVMEFLLSGTVSHGGLIGYMLPLVERAESMAVEMKIPFGIRALRLVHAISEQDAKLGRDRTKRAWAAAI